MSSGAVDVIFGAKQCTSGVGNGVPPPRVGIVLKGDAVSALYNLSEQNKQHLIIWSVKDIIGFKIQR